MRFWPGRGEAPTEPAGGEAVEQAFRRGREEERKRHRSHPVLATLMFLAAVVGVGMLYLAAQQGSFSGGGLVIDHRLAIATAKASQTTAQR